MKHDDARQLARYIMTTGKLIRDRIIPLHHLHFGSGKNKRVLRELSISQIQTVLTIYKSDKISMTDLSKQMGGSPPSSSAMVGRLVEKGILMREHSEKNRGKVIVWVGPSFKADPQTIEEAILLRFVVLVEKLGLETTLKLCNVLEKVKAALEVENLVEVGEVVARSALFRTESRGCHFRTDYRKTDQENWIRHDIIIRGEEPFTRKVDVTRIPLPVPVRSAERE